VTTNADDKTVEGFGEEWTAFDQHAMNESEASALFDRYFRIFPWQRLPQGAEGFDCGSGSGRWAVRVAPRVGRLHCVDASNQALDVARNACAAQPNVSFHHASVGSMPLAPASMDFGYSLGVLHHVPDTQAGIDACARLLKPGAPFLLYLYFAFDNRPVWFRAIWRASDLVRRLICRLPFILKRRVTDLIALTVYWPAARLAALLERRGIEVDHCVPLAAYRHNSLYTMRTDALDRFGTRLEQRFTRTQIEAMMQAAGLIDIVFSDDVPFWCAIGFKAGH
jgi:SAM-dependent methyltransferase